MLNRGITAETVTSGMVLQGYIESKETKGFMIDLGLKDKSKGFIKFPKPETDKEKEVGALVQVVVQSKTSKVIRCQFVAKHQDDDDTTKLQQVKTDLA